MKTLKISDVAHSKLTSIAGRLMAETGMMKTYSDALEAILSKSVILPPKLLDQIETFIKENGQLGYSTKEEFIQDAVRLRLAQLSKEEPLQVQVSDKMKHCIALTWLPGAE